MREKRNARVFVETVVLLFLVFIAYFDSAGDALTFPATVVVLKLYAAIVNATTLGGNGGHSITERWILIFFSQDKESKRC